MPNRLAGETSPYLLQHADNPVEWYPWGEEALTLAKRLDKPILLSIGYSACHWCHVMAHESFEDPATAAVMNAHFVNIKVDREERPDLDQIYQSAHALMTRRPGGWPLTVFLTPDQVPFYSGTYFPPSPRYGLPAFVDLLPRLAEAYHAHKAEIAQQRQVLLEAMETHAPGGSLPDGAVIAVALTRYKALFDPRNGGLGAAPKFPNVPDWMLVLRAASAGDAEARHMVVSTLDHMADGGIYDQLGGGFYRYSVDEHWEIPHFEKMLYDNGLLLWLYAESWTHARVPRWKTVIEETVDWLQREMHSPQGGFYASLDADSEGKEGRYYLWTPHEVHAALTDTEWAVARRVWGMDAAPNFEHAWHLRRVRKVTPEEEALLESARSKLLKSRQGRVRPGLDDKQLTSWNALAIQGLARAGRALGRDDWVALAQRAMDGLRATVWMDGRLYATHRNGCAYLNAYLDDHAFLLAAALELMQAAYRQQDLRFAIDLAETMLQRFEDEEKGGFFFTSHDHEPLLYRPKPAYDNAIPSGNGMAAFALQRLGHLLGEPRYLQAAERTLRAFSSQMHDNPAACPTLLMALSEWLEPPCVVILRGEPLELHGWSARLASLPLTGCLTVAIPAHCETGFPVLDKKTHAPVNAWVCRGVECMPAIHEWDALKRVLQPMQSPADWL
jgi:hypothetical protein